MQERQRARVNDPDLARAFRQDVPGSEDDGDENREALITLDVMTDKYWSRTFRVTQRDEMELVGRVLLGLLLDQFDGGHNNVVIEVRHGDSAQTPAEVEVVDVEVVTEPATPKEVGDGTYEEGS